MVWLIQTARKRSGHMTGRDSRLQITRQPQTQDLSAEGSNTPPPPPSPDSPEHTSSFVDPTPAIIDSTPVPPAATSSWEVLPVPESPPPGTWPAWPAPLPPRPARSSSRHSSLPPSRGSSPVTSAASETSAPRGLPPSPMEYPDYMQLMRERDQLLRHNLEMQRRLDESAQRTRSPASPEPSRAREDQEE